MGLTGPAATPDHGTDHGPDRVTTEVVEQTFRAHHGRCLATVARVLGDLEVAEDAVSEAYVSALTTWPARGLPDNPGAWITTTARNAGLDRLRRETRRPNREVAATRQDPRMAATAPPEIEPVPDDHLRLLFTTCHPALAPATRVALTLRLACGLRTAEIARAFLQPEATVAQRLSRARRRIRTAGIPFRAPDAHELPERLPGVLSCIELVYREGYGATDSADLVRHDLCADGVRLALLLAELVPHEPEVSGLAALLAFLDARRATRTSADGALQLLEDQDRSRWDRERIRQAAALLDRAVEVRRPGPYQLRAAIAAEHAMAPSFEDTDWPAIALLYRRLSEVAPSPVVELNRAIAIAFAESPAAGLAHLDTIADDPRLARSHLVPATRADLLRRMGRTEGAVQAYRAAIPLAPTVPERRYLQRRLARLQVAP